jgi:AcrR family transcriptional regulator
MRTAIELMGEQGYEGTSTRDIAGAAGVSVAALYYHFPSKLDLLREFLHEAHDVVLARLQRRIAEAGEDPRARLDAAVETIIASNLHDAWARRAAQVAWREIGRLEGPDQRAIAAKREAMVAQIADVVADLGSAEPTDVARAILTLCISVVDPISEPVQPMRAVVELHQRFALALVGTPPKPKRARTATRGR